MTRVAYDIGILGSYFNTPDPKTGIYRVTEELLYSLMRENSINLGLVDCCGEINALSFLNSEAFVKTEPTLLENYDSSYKSDFGLKTIYKKLYKAYNDPHFQNLPKYSFPSLIVRGGFKFLHWSRLPNLSKSQSFQTEKYDLLHSTYLKLPSKAITKSMPRVLMVHDLIPLLASRFVASGLDNYFAKVLNSIEESTDWIICNSDYTREEFCRYTGFPIEKTFITYLAADAKFCQSNEVDRHKKIRLKYNLGSDPFFLCLASQLDPRKNILHLIKSFLKLTHEASFQGTKLVLSGSLRYKREELEKAQKDLPGFSKNVILTGYVSDEDLVSLYNTATAFVFPSLYEGFGMPLLEAMQSGCPVISSNVTSLPEVVGDAGILIGPKDEDALCQSMLDLRNSESLRQAYIERGLTRAKQFSWKRCADQTVEIYKKVLA